MKGRYMRFGEFIKSKRLADPRELTLKDVAEKLGVSFTAAKIHLKELGLLMNTYEHADLMAQMAVSM